MAEALRVRARRGVLCGASAGAGGEGPNAQSSFEGTPASSAGSRGRARRRVPRHADLHCLRPTGWDAPRLPSIFATRTTFASMISTDSAKPRGE